MQLLAVRYMKIFRSKNRKSKATNISLNDLFLEIDRVQVKSDGVHEDKALSNDVVLTLDDPAKIKEFQRLMAIDEPSEDFHCMCLGDYAIELFAGSKLKSTIGFHHGVSIRFNLWTGDAVLKYPDELLELLSDLGLTAPLEQKKSDDEQANESEEESTNWLNNSPKTFSKYWNDINDFDEEYLINLKKDLGNEFKEEQSLIRALLKSYGTSNNLWTAYPMYESISRILLYDYQLNVIINAFIDSNNEIETKIGLGRYLFGWDFRNELKKHQEILDSEVLDLLFNTFEQINDSKGMESVEKLKKTK